MSTIFELDPEGWDKRLADASLNDTDFEKFTQPGFFKGSVIGPLKGFMQGAVDTVDTGLTLFGKSPSMSDEDERINELADTIQEEQHQTAAAFWRPGAHELGTAGRVLNGLGRIGVPLALGGGTPLVAAPAAALEGGKELIDEGVDSTTAGEAAAIRGLSTYAGFSVPFLGKTLAAKMATGAGLNTLIGGGSELAEKELLEQKGYDELASNYHPLDVESRAIDLLMGAAFGGAAHLQEGGLTPTERAAAMAAGDAKHFQQDTAPGIPADYTTQSAHAQANDIAMRQMMNGEQVSIPPELLEKMRFTPRPERAPVDAEVWRDVFGEDPPTAPEVEEREAFTAKAEPTGDEGIRNPLTFDASPEAKLGELKALTEQNVPVVNDVVKQLNEKLEGTRSKLNIKEDAKILEKASRPSILAQKPWHDVEHIRDALRFKTVIDSVDQLPKIIDVLNDAGIQAVKVDTGKLLTPGPWGWRIASLDLRMPNGQLVEHYMPLKEMEAAKKNGGHQLFEKWRNKDLTKLTPEERAEYQADRAKSNAVYQAAWEAAVARTGLDDTAAAASLKSFAAKAESLTSTKSSKSPPVTGTSVRQAPSTRSADTAGDKTSTVSGTSREEKTSNLGDAVMVDSSGAIVPDDGFVAPVISAVKELLTQRDVMTATEMTDADGNQVLRSGREVMAEAEVAIKAAEHNAKGIEAAVACALTRGFDA